jgi:hypothetical protein
MSQFVFLFRSGHAPQGSYYLIASDRYEVMEKCELAGYMVYVKRVPLNQVILNIKEIPDGYGNYYRSMAEAFVYSAPDACKQCSNRICGRTSDRTDVRFITLASKWGGKKLKKYPGIAGEERDDGDDAPSED